ncbi:Putative NAD(P)H-dependent FMN-containing oxidoreductase ywqN [Mycobacteroides abscessus subsp. abscessus]|nr:Putative NAD(P)H-dependent FMN-containing oxidoreductase ywqN [Mycobacteroides abscessus subsp. abscessus]
MKSIAVIDGGTRPNGNTAILTKQAIEGLSVEKILLRDYTIYPIIDMRHALDGFQNRNDDYHSIIDQVLAHDILIFSTPIYWYSMSGLMKNFVDRWSQSLRDANYPDFKAKMAEKKAYVIAVGGDTPHVKGLPMIQQFQHIFEFMGIEFGGYILGVGNQPGDILQDKNALFAAAQMKNELIS